MLLFLILFYFLLVERSDSNPGPMRRSLSKLFTEVEEGGEPSTLPSPTPAAASSAPTAETHHPHLTVTFADTTDESKESGRSSPTPPSPSPGTPARTPVSRGMKKKQLSRRQSFVIAKDASMSFVKQLSENINVETGINKPIIT